MKLAEIKSERTRMRLEAAMGSGGVLTCPARPEPATRAGRRALGVKTPNKTEAEYNRAMLDGRGQFEAVSFRLLGGSRYTPDFYVVRPSGRNEFHEVKGSYRHHSYGRALTAWREVAAVHPEFRFFWAVRDAGGTWTVTEFENGRRV